MPDTTEPTRRSVLRHGATTGALLIGGATVPGTAAAGPPERCSLNWGRELRASRCDGDLIINVTQEVVNDIDSGYHGHWAYVEYRRHIQAWQVADGEFCAVVTYHGQFDAVEGQLSPGYGDAGGDELSGGEHGTMQGGYAATIEGHLQDDPDWPPRGFVGTTDYRGDVQAGDRPGAIDWTEVYFPGGSFGYDWWGWIYHGGRCGTWVNSVDEEHDSCGDIHE